MIKAVIILFLLFQHSVNLATPCVGKFVNPVSDICWSCLFPISLGGITVYSGGQKDTKNPGSPICLCNKPPIGVLPGLSVGFWEPVRLVDVTRTPYCMVSLGGLQLGRPGVRGHGVKGSSHVGNTNHSFYQVHYYIYPLIYWLELLTDFLCLESANFDVGYITEFDLSWNDDEWGALFSPEAILFANPISQAACAADCTKATFGFPFDSLFWCAGCQGGLYPFTGHVPHHKGGVSASELLVQKIIAKFHRLGLALETSAESAKNLCDKNVKLIIKKTQYKTQLVYPVPITNSKLACNPLGKMTDVWGAGKEYPYKGEDFGYLVWRKRNCCVL